MPAYRRITDSLLEQVAGGALAPGTQLPSVRVAARRHGTTPATVGRAYARLAELGVIETAPRRSARVARDGAMLARRALQGGRALRLAGSDDPLLDQIAGTADRVGAAGSFAGLTALWQRRADAATVHVPDREGVYNAPFAGRILTGRRPVLVHLWRREQGIILPPGNPDGIDSVHGLVGRTLALRAPGTGTRVLLERLMREPGRDPSELRGMQAGTHLEAAMAVAAGIADAAIGLRVAAEQFSLDFVPLAWEPYELALSEDALNLAGELLAAIPSHAPGAGLDLGDAGTVRRLA